MPLPRRAPPQLSGVGLGWKARPRGASAGRRRTVGLAPLLQAALRLRVAALGRADAGGRQRGSVGRRARGARGAHPWCNGRAVRGRRRARGGRRGGGGVALRALSGLRGARVLGGLRGTRLRRTVARRRAVGDRGGGGGREQLRQLSPLRTAQLASSPPLRTRDKWAASPGDR
eukprot:scaffold81497_cov75-Phaeocystis_antarctica.AAC.3